jgi:uracil-DNA glycosylase
MIDFNEPTPYDKMDFNTFYDTCRACTGCQLSETRTQVVVGKGRVPNNLMVIGEGPGEKEDLEGEPFIGRAGQLLTKIFESVGIVRETDLYITNTVKCNGFLRRQINLVQPKVLVLLGNPALKTILGAEHTITKVRGKWFHVPVSYMEDPLYVMPLFHPSFLLRNASKDKGSPKWLTWNDMKEIKTALSFYDSVSKV